MIQHSAWLGMFHKPHRQVCACILPVLSILAGCSRSPARLVGGVRDTVIVNNVRSVQLPVRVLDARGRKLDQVAVVQFRWLSGTPLTVSSAGIATCTQTGDAIVRASLGSLATRMVIRCQPVGEVRTLRMVNIVADGPAQELPFEALDRHGEPVTILTGQVTVSDSTIATVKGMNVFGRLAGSTALDMRVGDRTAYASIHVYERAESPEKILPGQHLAIQLRLKSGDVRRWHLPPAEEVYFLTILPDGDELQMPHLGIVGAACSRGLDIGSYFCLAPHGAYVFAYQPNSDRLDIQHTGALAVWRQANP